MTQWGRFAERKSALTSFPGRTIAPLEATGVLYAGMWTEVSRQCAARDRDGRPGAWG